MIFTFRKWLAVCRPLNHDIPQSLLSSLYLFHPPSPPLCCHGNSTPLAAKSLSTKRIGDWYLQSPLPEQFSRVKPGPRVYFLRRSAPTQASSRSSKQLSIDSGYCPSHRHFSAFRQRQGHILSDLRLLFGPACVRPRGLRIDSGISAITPPLSVFRYQDNARGMLTPIFGSFSCQLLFVRANFTSIQRDPQLLLPSPFSRTKISLRLCALHYSVASQANSLSSPEIANRFWINPQMLLHSRFSCLRTCIRHRTIVFIVLLPSSSLPPGNCCRFNMKFS